MPLVWHSRIWWVLIRWIIIASPPLRAPIMSTPPPRPMMVSGRGVRVVRVLLWLALRISLRLHLRPPVLVLPRRHLCDGLLRHPLLRHLSH